MKLIVGFALLSYSHCAPNIVTQYISNYNILPKQKDSTCYIKKVTDCIYENMVLKVARNYSCMASS